MDDEVVYEGETEKLAGLYNRFSFILPLRRCTRDREIEDTRKIYIYIRYDTREKQK